MRRVYKSAQNAEQPANDAAHVSAVSTGSSMEPDSSSSCEGMPGLLQSPELSSCAYCGCELGATELEEPPEDHDPELEGMPELVRTPELEHRALPGFAPDMTACLRCRRSVQDISFQTVGHTRLPSQVLWVDDVQDIKPLYGMGGVTYCCTLQNVSHERLPVGDQFHTGGYMSRTAREAGEVQRSIREHGCMDI
jgi:hypothetical protein